MIVQCLVGLRHCYVGDPFLPQSPERSLPDNTIHWSNANVMLGDRLWGWANIIPTKTLSARHEYNRECIFSVHFLSTQVGLLNLATSNVILYLTCS